MHLGCPVIVSNISGYPDQVGDSGILVNPYDVISIAEGIELLTSNADLVTSLINKGRKQIEQKELHNRGAMFLDLARKAMNSAMVPSSCTVHRE